MSGITGIFRRDGQDVDPADIKKMNDKIAHRGPDGSRVWCEGPVAFGHQMLHTTQESLHETLPFEDEESGLVITADARIDNRKDLAPRLGIEDKEYVSDSYFILKAYEKWGEKCPEELLGDFAFAIWDKNKEQLLCARDHMGVKPFYYYLSNDFFLFATEIKSIISAKEVSCKINKIKVAEYMSLLFEDKKNTFYENIFRLPSANTLIINDTEYNKLNYWELNVNKEIKMDSDEEYTKAFLKIFTEAVKCRLRSAFPVGSLLSGGLDSSSIVCTARIILSEETVQTFHTFSATFENTPESDEQHYINQVLGEYKLKPHFIKADQLSPLSMIEDVLWHFDEPLYAVNNYIYWDIHQKANKTGVKVLLDGLDGDTTLSHGQRFEIDYLKSLKWYHGFKELYLHCKRSKRSILKQHIFPSLVLPFIPQILFDIFRMLRIPIPLEMGTPNLINENFAKETKVKQKVVIHENQFRKARSSKSYHHLLLKRGILQAVLERTDKSSAAANLEARYPFFDKRLIEFCLALPLEQKINNGWSRIILRRAMENILPRGIQWRPCKGNLGHNFRKNFLLFEKPLIDDILFNKTHLIEDYVNIDSVNEIYSKYVSDQSNSALPLFGIVTFSLWIQKIFNKYNDK
ncbi:lasso peptide isopeptide bond-forming cyclase [Methanobacterium sp. BAmetb5]|uniref:lasso peptide isopeptide bond-forming cyclase n=1 Tax=Methanobacterium sp. BAmetb5 TaxID=2025351 RepID=UPI000E97919E|nr:lasso peptide isopeptide bond-forming cyclase [Methanobacterium sp. BAmetb5]AXV38901.1 MAG: asparagine synthase (glutamine-hydrolyzing) [Methanobacterium sp. BAmetb5]